MKFKVFPVLALPFLFCIGCASQNMLKQKSRPDIKPDLEKATLIIFRSTFSVGFAKEIYNYIDDKYIGTTKGKCYFMTKLDPGIHYVVADAGNKACVKITFEAGKVYYLNQNLFFGAMSTSTGFTGSNPQDFEDQKEQMDFVMINPRAQNPTLDPKVYQQTIADHEIALKSDPKKHEDISDLKGY